MDFVNQKPEMWYYRIMKKMRFSIRKWIVTQLLSSILREWILLLGIVLCVAIMMATRLPCMQITVQWPDENIHLVNDVCFSLACSYIAAYLFYVLTVLYPRVKRRKQVIGISKEYLRYANDDFQFMLKTICGTSKITNKCTLLFVANMEKERYLDSILVSATNCNNILEELRCLNSRLQNVVSHIDYLNTSELKILKEVFEKKERCECYVKDKMRFVKKESYTMWGQNELEQLAVWLVSISNSLKMLYSELDKNI